MQMLCDLLLKELGQIGVYNSNRKEIKLSELPQLPRLTGGEYLNYVEFPA